MSWKLGSLALTKPDNFDINSIEVSRNDRTASGRLVKDIVAKKKGFALGYKGLSAMDTKAVVAIYDINDPIDFDYEDDGETKTAVVWFSSFSRSRLRSPEEYYQVSIGLEEQ